MGCWGGGDPDPSHGGVIRSGGTGGKAPWARLPDWTDPGELAGPRFLRIASTAVKTWHPPDGAIAARGGADV